MWGLKKNFALLELLERLQNGASSQAGMSEEALREMGEVRTQDLPQYFMSKYRINVYRIIFIHDQTLTISNTNVNIIHC